MNKKTIREQLKKVVEGVGGARQAEKILQEAGLDVSSGAITYWVTKSKLSPGVCRQKVLPAIKCLTAKFLELSRLLEKAEEPLPDIPQSDVLAKLRGLVAKHGTVVAAASYVMSQTDYPRRGWGLDTTMRSWLKKEQLSEKDKVKILRINQILDRPFRIKSLGPQAHEDVLLELISAAESANSFMEHLHPNSPTVLIDRLKLSIVNAKSLLLKRV